MAWFLSTHMLHRLEQDSVAVLDAIDGAPDKEEHRQYLRDVCDPVAKLQARILEKMLSLRNL